MPPGPVGRRTLIMGEVQKKLPGTNHFHYCEQSDVVDRAVGHAVSCFGGHAG